ncbi:MAG: VOC family protein [Rhodanobacteraceae bacterium]
MQIVPYLNFNGKTREAFAFYAKALNGKITAQMTYREAPREMCDQMPSETLDNIMHTQLESDGAMLMGADGPPQHSAQAVGTTINVMVDDPAEAERIFAALAEGGEIKMPIAETFWAQRWGMLIDRYGKPWMVNCLKPMGT